MECCHRWQRTYAVRNGPLNLQGLVHVHREGQQTTRKQHGPTDEVAQKQKKEATQSGRQVDRCRGVPEHKLVPSLMATPPKTPHPPVATQIRPEIGVSWTPQSETMCCGSPCNQKIWFKKWVAGWAAKGRPGKGTKCAILENHRLRKQWAQHSIKAGVQLVWKRLLI